MSDNPGVMRSTVARHRTEFSTLARGRVRRGVLRRRRAEPGARRSQPRRGAAARPAGARGRAARCRRCARPTPTATPTPHGDAEAEAEADEAEAEEEAQAADDDGRSARRRAVTAPRATPTRGAAATAVPTGDAGLPAASRRQTANKPKPDADDHHRGLSRRARRAGPPASSGSSRHRGARGSGPVPESAPQAELAAVDPQSACSPARACTTDERGVEQRRRRRRRARR